MPPARSNQSPTDQPEATATDTATPPDPSTPAVSLGEDWLAVLRDVDAALDPSNPEAVAHALRDFQQARELEPSGIIDEPTLAALQEAVAAKVEPDVRQRPELLRRGDTGQHVMDLQKLIVAPLTGAFDADTERRVRRIQSGAGLEPTGEVDAETWAAAEARTKS